MFAFKIFVMLVPSCFAMPTGSISTSILTPLSNIGDIANQKISAGLSAKTALLPSLSSFPDSGRKHAILETESLTSQLDAKYTQLQQFAAGLYGPKPLVDTIQEHEKYGNDGDKLRSIGTFIIGKYEGLSNALNAAVDLPFQKAKQVGKTITTQLNAVGGKLIGL
ncbi:uncharacterized protein LOC109598392 [Aethina tumida]|uniref:uncharacterized protein LOC109598392 n=1 Tax=Aethina tumida TaxID=116153 RepID=UPI00096B63E6|nr:uncharacterized protein LOC109598392 [Aethina tumida]